MKVLFIGTGNTCRTAMADAMFKHMIKNTKLEGEMLSLSAGLSPINGKPVDEKAVCVMEEMKIDLKDHKARRFNSNEIPVWDVYFTMNSTHAYILEKAGIPNEKIYHPEGDGVSDPYGYGIEKYRVCREELEAELSKFIRKLSEIYD